MAQDKDERIAELEAERDVERADAILARKEKKEAVKVEKDKYQGENIRAEQMIVKFREIELDCKNKGLSAAKFIAIRKSIEGQQL